MSVCDLKHVVSIVWCCPLAVTEMKKVENVHMGMGAKPGLDLKPSKDNISDRLITVSLANRGQWPTPHR